MTNFFKFIVCYVHALLTMTFVTTNPHANVDVFLVGFVWTFQTTLAAVQLFTLCMILTWMMFDSKKE